METIVISGKTYDEATIINEKEESIRLEAVDLCFALSKLARDESELIRAAVARKKVAHDILVNDKCWKVRATVAKYTDDTAILDKLINDEKDFVRFIIVKREYALKFYLEDDDEEIASIAKHLMKQKKQ